MMDWLLLLSWIWPLLLAAVAPSARFWWAPGLGALPALITALVLPLGTTLELPWLFLGTTLGLDALTQVYLVFTSLLWLVAGVYAAFAHRGGEHAGRFNLLFLLAMAGNLWLIVGHDLFSFYVGFAIMGLSSYGLVIHDGRPASLRAGKVYLVMALFGEVCLFAAMVLIASQTGTTVPSAEDLVVLDGLAIALLLLGLGVKAGMVPLHIWLPLAHPAAPIAASAVLSGTMIKTALLGWMRFLPVGALALPEWGGLLASAGTLTLLYALPIGLGQSDPKVVLAYSSISKMGLMMLVLGLALIEPALAPVAIAGIAFYAASHALVKGGLFLGVGMRKHAATQPPMIQALVLGALVFLALSLAGAPFTSGAVAKYGLKPVFGAFDWVWISAVVGVSTFATTLLMVRFVWVSLRTQTHPEAGYRWPGVAWGVLIALVLLSPLAFGKPSAWMTNLVNVPLALNLGLVALLFALLRPKLLRPLVDRIPPGDILALYTPVQAHAFNWLQRADQRWKGQVAEVEQYAVGAFDHIFGAPGGDTERGLRQWPVAGGVWVGISTLLLVFVLAGLPAVPDTADPAGAPPVPEAMADMPGADPSLGPARTAAPESVINTPVVADNLSETQPVASVPAPQPSTGIADPAPAQIPKAQVEKLPAPDDPPEQQPAPQPAFGPTTACVPHSIYLFAPDGIPAEPLPLTSCAANALPLRVPELSPALVERVQQALRLQGYEPGPADGIIGPRTRAAIDELQRDNGQEADGIISFAVLDLLQARVEHD